MGVHASILLGHTGIGRTLVLVITIDGGPRLNAIAVHAELTGSARIPVIAIHGRARRAGTLATLVVQSAQIAVVTESFVVLELAFARPCITGIRGALVAVIAGLRAAWYAHTRFAVIIERAKLAVLTEQEVILVEAFPRQLVTQIVRTGIAVIAGILLARVADRSRAVIKRSARITIFALSRVFHKAAPPVKGSHTSSVQMFSSAHVTAVPPWHCPLTHWSSAVQRSPSSQCTSRLV
jgi:hypothetical protein